MKTKTGLLIANLVCALLLIAIVVGQFVPFWTVTTSEGEDSASLIGMTGRQYNHEEMIEILDEKVDGFSYQNISVQVLITIVVGAFAAYLCLRNSQGIARIVFAFAVALAGISLWLLVPAYTMGMTGHVLFVLDMLLLLVAVILLLQFIDRKKQEKQEREAG